ncbi:hypothetical protein BaRGS_00029422, partial [Batillaria attramentaria]
PAEYCRKLFERDPRLITSLVICHVTLVVASLMGSNIPSLLTGVHGLKKMTANIAPR